MMLLLNILPPSPHSPSPDSDTPRRQKNNIKDKKEKTKIRCCAIQHSAIVVAVISPWTPVTCRRRNVRGAVLLAAIHVVINSGGHVGL